MSDGSYSPEMVYVSVEAMDKVVDDSPTVIKIDVEGYEMLVLGGMKRILNNPSLHSVIIELNGSGKKYGFPDESIIHLMYSAGFIMYRYEPFSRELQQLQDQPAAGNVMFIRDFGEVKRKLMEAEPFSIMGGNI